MSNVILFLQSDIELETRTHSIYDSVNECLDGICKIYKAHLMKLNPNVQITTFKMTQLFEFIDHLADIKCFVFQRNTRTYVSFDKNWIKEKIHEGLKCRATQRQVSTNFVGLQEAKIENHISGELLDKKKIIREIGQAAERNGSKLWHLYYT